MDKLEKKATCFSNHVYLALVSRPLSGPQNVKWCVVFLLVSNTPGLSVCVFFLFVLWSGRRRPGGRGSVREDAIQRSGCQAQLLPKGRVPAADLQEPRDAVPASGGPRGACCVVGSRSVKVRYVFVTEDATYDRRPVFWG